MGGGRNVAFSEVAGSSVTEKGKKIAMTTLGTWGLTSKKSFGRRGPSCGEAGRGRLLEVLAESQACS